jgi:ribosomal protein L40E
MEWSPTVLDEDEDGSFYDETNVAVAEYPLIITPQTRLHYFTNILTNEYCQTLLRTLRDAKICKFQSNAVIKLLESALSEPNNMLSSLKQLLSAMNVENLFVKKKVCIRCENEVPTEQNFCNQCRMADLTKVASIYDIDLDRALSLLLRQSSTPIDEYQVKLDSTGPTKATSDVPFGMPGRELLLNRSVNQKIYFFSLYAQR